MQTSKKLRLDPGAYAHRLLELRASSDEAIALAEAQAYNLAHVVTLQVDSFKLTMFAADLLRDTGYRFVQALCECDKRHAVLHLDPRGVPSAETSLQLLVEPLPEWLHVSTVVDTVRALTYCNAYHQLDALAAALRAVPFSEQIVPSEDVLTLLEATLRDCPFPPLHHSVAGIYHPSIDSAPDSVAKFWDALMPHVTTAQCAEIASSSTCCAWLWISLGALVCQGTCANGELPTLLASKSQPSLDELDVLRFFLKRGQHNGTCACRSRIIMDLAAFNKDVPSSVSSHVRTPVVKQRSSLACFGVGLRHSKRCPSSTDSDY